MNTFDICNMALTSLGVPPITSFADNCEPARHCQRLFPIVRDRVLRDHYWSFAAAGRQTCRLVSKKQIVQSF